MSFSFKDFARDMAAIFVPYNFERTPAAELERIIHTAPPYTIKFRSAYSVIRQRKQKIEARLKAEETQQLVDNILLLNGDIKVLQNAIDNILVLHGDIKVLQHTLDKGLRKEVELTRLFSRMVQKIEFMQRSLDEALKKVAQLSKSSPGDRNRVVARIPSWFESELPTEKYEQEPLKPKPRQESANAGSGVRIVETTDIDPLSVLSSIELNQAAMFAVLNRTFLIIGDISSDNLEIVKNMITVILGDEEKEAFAEPGLITSMLLTPSKEEKPLRAPEEARGNPKTKSTD